METKMLLLANLCPGSSFLEEMLCPEMVWDGHVGLKYEVLLRLEPGLVVTETVDPEGKAHVVLHAFGIAWREMEGALEALGFRRFERCPEAPEGLCFSWVLGVSSKDPEWRELVDLVLNALTDLRTIFPEASRAWSEIAGVFRRLLRGLPPLDKALLSVAADLKKV